MSALLPEVGSPIPRSCSLSEYLGYLDTLVDLIIFLSHHMRASFELRNGSSLVFAPPAPGTMPGTEQAPDTCLVE